MSQQPNAYHYAPPSEEQQEQVALPSQTVDHHQYPKPEGTPEPWDGDT